MFHFNKRFCLKSYSFLSPNKKNSKSSRWPTPLTISLFILFIASLLCQPAEVTADHTLITSANPSYMGTITRYPDKPTYEQGEQVILTAIPFEYYDFEYWSGDLTGSGNPKTITMGTDKGVTANFRIKGGGLGCYHDLPPLELVLTGTQDVEIMFPGDSENRMITVYNLSVTNWAEFPDELFEFDCEYTRCREAIVTSVSFPIETDDRSLQIAKRLGLITSIESASDLTRIWFWKYQNSAPNRVYVTLFDQRCNPSLVLGEYRTESNYLYIDQAPPRHALTLSSSDGGQVLTPGEGTFEYDRGTFIRLVARADSGYRFSHWSCNVTPRWNCHFWKVTYSYSANTWAFVDEDYELVAIFEPAGFEQDQLCVTGQSEGFSLDVPPGALLSETAWVELKGYVSLADPEDIYYDAGIDGASVWTDDGYLLGQTYWGGNIEGIYPITDPPMVGQCDKQLVAYWGDESAKSDPVTFYSVKETSPISTEVIDGARADAINLRLWLTSPNIPTPSGYPSLFSFIWSLLRTALIYHAREGDEITHGVYKYTIPEAQPVYRIYLKIIRKDGQTIIEKSIWTYEDSAAYYIDSGGTYTLGPDTGSPDIVVTLASPGTLYITDPRGLHGGYDPGTNELVAEFPLYIGGPDDEPFYVVILDPIDGWYDIRFTPKSGASADETYTLKASIGEVLITLAKDVEIGQGDSVYYGIEVRSEGSVIFDDANLKAAIEAALGVADPNWMDMLQLTELTARGSDIYSLSGLEYAVNLTELDLGWNSIDDLSPLAGLSSLRLLHLDNNAISDVDPLLDLTTLEALWLDSNQISDISALAGLMNLQWLELSRNPLNQEACDVYIPQIKVNNPGIQVYETSCATNRCTLTISSTTGGWVYSLQGDLMMPGNAVREYPCGIRVPVSASPDSSHHFVNWTGTAVTAGKVDSPTSTSTMVTMDADYTLVANFAPNDQCILTISSTEGGSVCLPSSGQLPVVTPITDGAYTYVCGTEHLFYAQADLDYHFVCWTGTLVDAGKIDPTSSAVRFVLDGDYTLVANFEPDEPEPQYSLGIAILPSGAGSVACVPDKPKYSLGETVTVTATPAPGYVFSHWSGITQVADPLSATTWLTIEDGCHIIANFEPIE